MPETAVPHKKSSAANVASLMSAKLSGQAWLRKSAYKNALNFADDVYSGDCQVLPQVAGVTSIVSCHWLWDPSTFREALS